jgi:hypothetical protein
MERPLNVPSVHTDLDLLVPEVLRLSDRGAEGHVPPALAEQWLRDDWASYGLDPADVPGLPSAVG